MEHLYVLYSANVLDLCVADRQPKDVCQKIPSIPQNWESIYGSNSKALQNKESNIGSVQIEDAMASNGFPDLWIPWYNEIYKEHLNSETKLFCDINSYKDLPGVPSNDGTPIKNNVTDLNPTISFSAYNDNSCSKNITNIVRMTNIVESKSSGYQYSQNEKSNNPATLDQLKPNNSLYESRIQKFCPLKKTLIKSTANGNQHLVLYNNTHKRKEYNCDICSKEFKKQSHLLRHMNIHTREKLYTCDICSKSFTDPSSLRKHINTHTREKLYTCHMCQKDFTDPSDLRRHINTHTREKVFT